jgi:hypothetical protein
MNGSTAGLGARGAAGTGVPVAHALKFAGTCDRCAVMDPSRGLTQGA